MSRRHQDRDSTESTPEVISDDDVTSNGWSHRFYQGFYLKHLSVELDNTRGSVARDHLANERTYLAWLRTSLSFASAGVGVTQLLRLNTIDDRDRKNKRAGRLRKVGKPAGALMVTVALMVIIFGSIRYFRAQTAMQRGKFPASRLMVGLLSLITIFILLAGFFILLILNPAAAM